MVPKLSLAPRTAIDYSHDCQSVRSVQYTENDTLKSLDATDVLIAAGPWTPRIFPKAHLRAPRGHSVVVRPRRALSPYVLDANISPAPRGRLREDLFLEIFPRPDDGLNDFDTVYSCGPDDYDVTLPATSDLIEVNEKSCTNIWDSLRSVSQEIHDGNLLTKQACYKAQIRPHDEGEEVGPMVGATGIKGLWLATGHDEWGIQNAPGTGLVMSEMIFEGAARSADCESLNPNHFLANG